MKTLLSFLTIALFAVTAFAQGDSIDQEFDQFDTAAFPLECACDDYTLAIGTVPGANVSGIDSVSVIYKETTTIYAFQATMDVDLEGFPRRIRIETNDGQQKTIVCDTERAAKRYNIGRKLEYSGAEAGRIELRSLNPQDEFATYDLGRYNPLRDKTRFEIPEAAPRPGLFALVTPDGVLQLVSLKQLR